MIGLNILGMLWNAWYREDIPDQRRIRYVFGIFQPISNTVPFSKDYNQALRLMWRNRKPWKIWHRTKHICVEWNRMDPQRGAKVGMDFIFWAFVAGFQAG